MRKNQKTDLQPGEVRKEEHLPQNRQEEENKATDKNSLENSVEQTAEADRSSQAGKTANRLDQKSPENSIKGSNPSSALAKTEHNGSTAGGSAQEEKPHKNKNHGSFYLGLASAILIAAIGISLSTLPILISIPLAAILFGIGIWFLSYASLHSFSQSAETISASRSSRLILITTVLLVLQTFIMDVFIFTRLGTVEKYQNPIIIMWIICTMVEAVAALVLIFSFHPGRSRKNRSGEIED